MSRTTGILSLGVRKDATTWEKGCEKLGISARLPIKRGSPTLDELKTFFSGKGHWFFFGGHFGGRSLSNESGDVDIRFDTDRVQVTLGKTTTALTKETHAFNLNETCEVVLWGGCSVCDSPDTIETLRTLFGNHVLLGFAGLTGWRVVDAMLGGGFIEKDHFFDRLGPDRLGAEAVRDAWMQTALKGYGGGDLEGRFRAIDPDGQEWRLEKKKVVRGKKF